MNEIYSLPIGKFLRTGMFDLWEDNGGELGDLSGRSGNVFGKNSRIVRYASTSYCQLYVPM